MAKIQKYSVIGSSERSNGSYIKVSELRELLEGEKNKLEKHLGWQKENLGDGWDTAHTTGELYSVNKYLSAIGTEEKSSKCTCGCQIYNKDFQEYPACIKAIDTEGK